jgi:hypothetical protein
MTRPLRSTPTAPSRNFTATTSRSASTPQIGTQSLTGSSPLGTLPLAAPNHQRRQYQGMPSHVPCESSRSDSRRLHAGHRPASQRPSAGLLPRHSRFALVLMSPITSNDTSTAIPNIGTAHRLPDPHLTQSSAPFPCRSPRRSSANAAHGGLEPPAVERFRRAYLHLSHSTASRSLDYMIRPLSAFVAHQEP